METFIGRVYKLESTQNFNEFLKELEAFNAISTEVNKLTRKFATSAKPKVALIGNKDGTFSLTSATGLLKTRQTFTPGVEFEEVAMNGGRCMSLIIFNGNTMVHTQKGDKEIKIVREFSNEKMLLTIYSETVVAKRYFKAVS